MDKQKILWKNLYSRGELGYVYYDNLGQIGANEYTKMKWDSVRQAAMRYLGRQDELLDEESGYQETINKLSILAENEYKKEVKFLQEYFGLTAPPVITANNTKILLEMMNDALGLPKVWRRVIDRMKKQRDMAASSRSTSIANTYGSYLDEVLKKSMISFFSSPAVLKNIEMGNTDKVLKDMETRVKEGTYLALKNMLSAYDTNKKKWIKEHGNEQLWLEILDAINTSDKIMKRWRKEFKTEMFSRFGLQKLIDDIQTKYIEALQNGVDLKQLYKIPKEIIMKSQKNIDKRPAHGFTAEKLVLPLIKAIQKRYSDMGFNVDVYNSPVMSTFDQVLLFQKQEYSVDLKLDPKLFGQSKTKSEVEQRCADLANNLENKAFQGTVVYENDKNYSLSNTFERHGGYHGGGRRLDQLTPWLDRLGIKNTQLFLARVKNSVEGAVFESGSKDFFDKIAGSLAAEVAGLLFDDMYVKTGIGAIHIFRLNDVVVPLSFFLKHIAESLAASQTASGWVSFDVSGKVMYSYPQQDTTIGGSMERWQRQKEASSGFTFNIRFLENFKRIF